ncbi:ATPase [Qipengyuania qiaonensis]|uniref:ATPase n=1 Tax=Qipengyuania qiaonensis TaxID=2867240 RepID=A0ABS7J6E2_9SPHN|nr:ATPase [Qipengyuania qiaonensis]MBX7481198.1 ATPase [Qipengyuania qiaonensis]
MRKRPLIQAVDHSTDEDTPEIQVSEDVNEETSSDDEELFQEEWPEDEELKPRRGWLAPALAITVILGWTAFFGWAHHAFIQTGPTPDGWSALATQWSIPVLLVVAVWLLAMRNSTREARRFSEVAHALSTQSAELEARLVTVNRELSLAREFLTSQTRELDYLGRTATDRLSEHADRLQSLIGENGDKVESIARVSVSALENMGKLRDNLPVIANSAKDVSNQIGGAGREARSQLDDLIEGFERLNEFGAASERQVASLRKRVDASLDAFAAQADQLGDIAEQRFSELRNSSEAFRGELDSREIDALASIRKRFESLRAELAETNAAAGVEREAAMESLNNRLETVRRESKQFAETIRDGEAHALTAWASQIAAMQERLGEAVAEIASIDEAATASASSKLKELFNEAENVDARIAERNRLFSIETGRRQTEFDEAEEAAHTRLTERLAALDETIAERRAAQAEQLSLISVEGEELGERIAALGATFESVSLQGREAHSQLSDGIDALNTKLLESREALDGTDMAVAALTDASVRLLELIQASAKHGREDLPVAIEESEARLAEIERRATEVKSLLDQAKSTGEALTSSMDAAEVRSREAIAGVDHFQAHFGETAAAQVDGIERLRASVAALGDESATVSARAQGELRDAIATLEGSARNALTAIETEQAERIKSIAENVGAQSAEAIDKALREHTEEAISSLDRATERSAETGREVTRQLRDQLAKVNELAGNLESRIAHARERATEDVGNDFSRRVALITESLNSNAIDIAKALSTEITDTAWASYLRGDRGIFTRRAVRLLDNTEAREIAELYDSDHDFREHVSRYIHDFEAMLRTMLSTRDGNAVSVTLLSSDMGKLYVVLAQALERLR